MLNEWGDHQIRRTDPAKGRCAMCLFVLKMRLDGALSQGLPRTRADSGGLWGVLQVGDEHVFGRRTFAGFLEQAFFDHVL